MDKFLRLHNELHARPLPEIHVGSTVFDLAYFRGPVSISKEKEHLDRLMSKLKNRISNCCDANGYGYRFNSPLDLGILTPIVLLLVALTINSIRRRYAD